MTDILDLDIGLDKHFQEFQRLVSRIGFFNGSTNKGAMTMSKNKTDEQILAEGISLLIRAPNEVLVTLIQSYNMTLSALSKGECPQPLVIDEGALLQTMMGITALVMLEKMNQEEKQQQPVKDVSQAADLLKRFTLH